MKEIEIEEKEPVKKKGRECGPHAYETLRDFGLCLFWEHMERRQASASKYVVGTAP